MMPLEVLASSSKRGATYEPHIEGNVRSIAAEHSDTIFTPFFRGNDAVSSGVGLGLPISRPVAQAFQM